MGVVFEEELEDAAELLGVKPDEALDEETVLEGVDEEFWTVHPTGGNPSLELDSDPPEFGPALEKEEPEPEVSQ